MSTIEPFHISQTPKQNLFFDTDTGTAYRTRTDGTPINVFYVRDFANNIADSDDFKNTGTGAQDDNLLYIPGECPHATVTITDTDKNGVLSAADNVTVTLRGRNADGSFSDKVHIYSWADVLNMKDE